MTQERGVRPAMPRLGFAPPATIPASVDVAHPEPEAAVAPAFSQFAFYVTAALLFIHFGRPFDMFLKGYRIPAIVCSIGILVVLLSGSLRLLGSKVGLAFLCLLGWMAICAPFSFWRGGSSTYVLWYIQFYLILMLMMATASRTPKDMVKLCGVLVFSSCFHLIVNGGEQAGRFALQGTWGNSDDVALLAGYSLPFWVVVSSRVRSAGIRYALLAGGCGYLLVLIGRTATRAAIPALIIMMAVYFFRVDGSRKVAIVAFGVLGSLLALLVLPQSAIDRLASVANVFSSKGGQTEQTNEAQASLNERRELMNDAIKIAIEHPLFGVGPGQFVEYRFNKVHKENGGTKPYLPAHNTYLEVASESGFVGLFFYLTFLLSVYLAICRSRKANARRPNPDSLISPLCLCAEAALTYFAVCAAFMTCDKHPHQFVLAGMAIALSKYTASDEGKPITQSSVQTQSLPTPMRSVAPPQLGPLPGGRQPAVPAGPVRTRPGGRRDPAATPIGRR